jgi:hypothetical protein
VDGLAGDALAAAWLDWLDVLAAGAVSSLQPVSQIAAVTNVAAIAVVFIFIRKVPSSRWPKLNWHRFAAISLMAIGRACAHRHPRLPGIEDELSYLRIS